MTLANDDRIIARDGLVELNGQFILHQENRGQSEFQHLKGEKTITQKAIERFLRNVSLSAAYCSSRAFPTLTWFTVQWPWPSARSLPQQA